MKIKLKNPYQINKPLTLLLKGYSLFPDNSKVVKKPLIYLYYLIYLLSRVWGFCRLKRGSHAYLSAKHLNGKEFSIRDTNSQFHSIYFDAFKNVYEPDVSAAIQLFLKDGDVLIDIGSNWGHHSFDAVISKNASVIAFEPNPLVSEDINRIASKLDVTDKIIMNQTALGSRPGSLVLNQNYFESGSASVSKSFSANRLAEKHISILHRIFRLTPIKSTVEVKTLDMFAIEAANFIKIDAEGFELEILKGGQELISRLKPVICFEYHSSDLINIKEYKNFFSAAGYILYEMMCNKTRLEIDEVIYSFSLVKIKYLESNAQYNLIALPSDYPLASIGC